MRKFYSSGTIPLGIFSLLSLIMTVTGIILLNVGIENSNIVLLLLGLGIPMGIIALPLFIAILCTFLIVDDKKIIFPITRVPRAKFKRNAIPFSEIECVKMSFTEGDGIIILDSYTLTFVLKNGLEFTENFRSQYGKKQEIEIINLLREKVRFIE